MALRSVAARNGNCDLFENDAGFDPCAWTPRDICHGSTTEQCTCSGILYLVWAACDACSPNPINTTWDDYSNQIFDCSGLPQQFPPPFPTGEETFPSWAFSMVSATPEPTIFDLAAASAFVLGSSSTPAPPPNTSTPDQPPTTAKTSSTSTSVPTTGTTSLGTTTSARSANSSTSPPSTVLSSQGIAPSHGLTVPLSPSITASVSSGSNVPPTSTSSQQDQLSAHRNSFPAGAVAGIVIGICLMIALAIFYLCLRRRRRQAADDVSPLPIISPYANTSGPSNIGAWDSDAQIITTRRIADPPLPSSTTTSPDAPSVPSNASAWNGAEAPLIPISRRHMQTESRTAQEKMDLNEERVSSLSFAHPAGINPRVLSTFSASNTGAAAPDPDVVLQLRAMTARVRELEAQIESPQVYEWRATPPPGYSGDGRSSMRVSRQS
ncbi:hypothetical protein MVEN_00479700 [Mycena venus]|uniref:Extracellular membrane protein CFEM domain-containing protein n=1 Tax=Mycena venus TaxID=2733690 RepID=A0A8H6YY99_9AGAR|nr:hypothetical protein MVEN_00479700 [Mycena venus]